MNVVVLQGNLTKDPETTVLKRGKKGESDKTLTSFTIALNGRDEHTSFIDCVAFNRTGDVISEYFSKGDKICVSGSLYQRVNEYKKNKESLNISQVTVTVNEFSFCAKK